VCYGEMEYVQRRKQEDTVRNSEKRAGRKVDAELGNLAVLVRHFGGVTRSTYATVQAVLSPASLQCGGTPRASVGPCASPSPSPPRPLYSVSYTVDSWIETPKFASPTRRHDTASRL